MSGHVEAVKPISTAPFYWRWLQPVASARFEPADGGFDPPEQARLLRLRGIVSLFDSEPYAVPFLALAA